MAYEKQTWQCGDTISAEKLNHMEDGIAEGGGSSTLVATETAGASMSFVLDKTWQEIFDAMPNVMILSSDGKTKQIVRVVSGSANTYSILSATKQYAANEPNGYPATGGVG